MPEPERAAQAQALRSGPGRILVAVYAVFALSACARSAVQLGTRFDQAPLAYLLSGFAAAVYVLATVCLVRGARKLGTAACLVELVGVLAVGTLSLLDPAAFPEATVWSAFGQGYGYIPVVLPVLGLWWLAKAPKRPEGASGAEARPGDAA